MVFCRLCKIVSHHAKYNNKVQSQARRSEEQGFATKIGDEVRVNYRVKGNQVKETTGIVSEMSKNGYVRLCTCRRWLTVVRNLRSVEKHGGFKEMTSKKDKFHGISDW